MNIHTTRIKGAAGSTEKLACFLPSSAEAAPIGGAGKRYMDVAIAVMSLIALAPIMVFIAVLVRATLGGPAFFGHQRVGYGGRVFHCWKFRTMVANGDEILRKHFQENPASLDEWNRNQKLRVDPRVTRLGRMLRISSLDEIPQLVNILRGDMSCVGPRPVVASELERFGDKAADYLRARPGLTGLWQISGRSTCTYEQRVTLDSDYVRNWSFKRDLMILLKTIPTVLRTDRAG
jgi:exopolysaccharide production protein ExoY